jgi:putative ATP-dependent endonuclease of OLD family
MTFLLGPNGSGKTAVLQALTRMFGFERSMRAIRRNDFHADLAADPTVLAAEQRLWIEANFEFPELLHGNGTLTTIPTNFAHMQLLTADGVPCVRIRLDAVVDIDGEIEETLRYVIESDDNGEPTKTSNVTKDDRNSIQVHYLPARRDPADHVSYATSTLLGKALRAANWTTERETVGALAKQITDTLAANAAIDGISSEIRAVWGELHRGSFYTQPAISFLSGELERLLRHLTIGFCPGEVERSVDYSRLSDGQKSLLYFALVLALHQVGRKALTGENQAFDVEKLRPAIFTIVAIEEPENSLSPHHIGRVIDSLRGLCQGDDLQALVATHSPSILKRVEPEKVRYLRLTPQRETSVKSIVLPPETDEAHKYVREAVQAYPELYFSRLVVLGEGDSEEIVLPRLFHAFEIGTDQDSISVVPLGGRHVNHFWRLLGSLEIPHLTILDLDLARFQGGWGRVRYASQQLLKLPSPPPTLTQQLIDQLPAWNSGTPLIASENGEGWFDFLRSAGVFFSSPLDLDFVMLGAFPAAYHLLQEELSPPAIETLTSVLGKANSGSSQYSEAERQLFDAYHTRFKVGSKPANHLEALAKLTNDQLRRNVPQSLVQLMDAVRTRIAGIPE